MYKKIVAGIFSLGVFFVSGCANSDTNEKVLVSEATEQAEISQLFVSVSAQQFKQFIDKITQNDTQNIIIDVRTFPEFQAGHIKNAKLIDVSKTDFIKKISKLEKEKRYFIYCRSGHRSKKAFEIMKQQGFKTVYNLKYGINDWNRNNFPLVH